MASSHSGCEIFAAGTVLIASFVSLQAVPAKLAAPMVEGVSPFVEVKDAITRRVGRPKAAFGFNKSSQIAMFRGLMTNDRLNRAKQIPSVNATILASRLEKTHASLIQFDGVAVDPSAARYLAAHKGVTEIWFRQCIVGRSAVRELSNCKDLSVLFIVDSLMEDVSPSSFCGIKSLKEITFIESERFAGKSLRPLQECLPKATIRAR